MTKTRLTPPPDSRRSVTMLSQAQSDAAEKYLEANWAKAIG